MEQEHHGPDVEDKQAQNGERLKRAGLLRWWLLRTAPSGTLDYDHASTYQMREHLRRAGLTSFVAPFVCIAPLLLLQQATSDPGTAIGIVVLVAFAFLSLVFNRFGMQTAAAILLIVSMDVIIEGTLLTAKGGLGVGWLLTFDLFIIPLITAGVLLSRNYLLVFLFLHITFILGDFYALPHTSDLKALIVLWHGPAIAFARPIVIQIGACLLSFIQVGSTNQAIARADRAETVAALQQSIEEQNQRLQGAIQEILKALVTAANGHFAIRVSLPQDNILWQIAYKLNTLFERLQSSKNAQATVQQTEIDARRLVEAIRSARSGQYTLWPVPTGGPLDPLIQEVKNMVVPQKPSQSTEQRPNPRTY
jgi:hypothetical protein